MSKLKNKIDQLKNELYSVRVKNIGNLIEDDVIMDIAYRTNFYMNIYSHDLGSKTNNNKIGGNILNSTYIKIKEEMND